MEVTGYTGKITCPSFNRVCTSKIYVSFPTKAALNYIMNIDLNFINIDNIENKEENEDIKYFDSDCLISDDFHSSYDGFNIIENNTKIK